MFFVQFSALVGARWITCLHDS